MTAAEVKAAVDQFYNDTSRTKEETHQGLDEILQHTYELYELLGSEIDREEEDEGS